MSTPLVTIEKAPQGYAVLTLNRPDALNALSSSLRRQFCAAFADFTADSAVRVVILTGNGRAFSAGLDLKNWNDSDAVAGGAFDTDPVRAMMKFSGPVIGAINGLTVTGGLEIAVACDLLLASSDARFADTHVRVGMLPGWGLSVRLARAIGASRAKELSLTGAFLSAERALAWGLVNRVVAPDELMPQARQLAAEMCAGDPATLIAYKQLIDDGRNLPFREALAMERARAIEANSPISRDDIENRLSALQARARDRAK
jgi:enoyl-CoA hydratase